MSTKVSEARLADLCNFFYLCSEWFWPTFNVSMVLKKNLIWGLEK
jgi:hypothetical protein